MSSLIGIVGGLGPEGTVHYYRKLVRALAATPRFEDRPGIVVDHVWIDGFVALLRAGADDAVQRLLGASLRRLHEAGADLAMMGAVTPHLFLAQVREQSPIEVVDIVEATRQELLVAGHRTIGLLGTRLTLSTPFFKSPLEAAGIRVVLPDAAATAYLDDFIFGPLASGTHTGEMRRALGDIVRKMAVEEGVDAVVVACTDLMDVLETTAPLVDPIDCHIRLAVRTLLARGKPEALREPSPPAGEEDAG